MTGIDRAGGDRANDTLRAALDALRHVTLCPIEPFACTHPLHSYATSLLHEDALAVAVPAPDEGSRGYELRPADDPAWVLVVVDGEVVARVPREPLTFPAPAVGEDEPPGPKFTGECCASGACEVCRPDLYRED